MPFAATLEESDARLSALVTSEVLESIVALIPESWLGLDTPFATPRENREAYTKYLQLRLQQRHSFVQEALRARSQLV